MELVFFSSILLTFLLFVLMVLKFGKRSKPNEKCPNLPPGPWKLPFIGNLHQLVGSLPHHALRRLAKKYGPLMHLQLGEISTIIVSSSEYAGEVLKTHDIAFASRRQLFAPKIITNDSSDIVFSAYGVYWKQLRKICTLELLSTKRVQSFRSIREEEVSNLIHCIASKAESQINLTEELNSLICGIVSRAAFGNKCKDQELFISAIDEVIKAASGFNIIDLFPSVKLLQLISGIKSRLDILHQVIDRISEDIINEHKRDQEPLNMQSEGHEDLVDILLKVQDYGGLELSLTTEDIKAVIFDTFAAGIETSATTINWSMSEMIKNPRLMKKAQAEVRKVFNRKGKIDEAGVNELKFLKLVIKETLRLHPPAPLIPRECRERCVIKGFDIPNKTNVCINVWAIGRDPEYWTDPENFIPERFLHSSIDYRGTNFEYFPFGAGRRICPGISFGLASVELPLAMLLYHFDWKLPNGMKHEDLDMTETFGLAVKRKDNLCLIPIPYHLPDVAQTRKKPL